MLLATGECSYFPLVARTAFRSVMTRKRKEKNLLFFHLVATLFRLNILALYAYENGFKVIRLLSFKFRALSRTCDRNLYERLLLTRQTDETNLIMIIEEPILS